MKHTLLKIGTILALSTGSLIMTAPAASANNELFDLSSNTEQSPSVNPSDIPSDEPTVDPSATALPSKPQTIRVFDPTHALGSNSDEVQKSIIAGAQSSVNTTGLNFLIVGVDIPNISSAGYDESVHRYLMKNQKSLSDFIKPDGTLKDNTALIVMSPKAGRLGVYHSDNLYWWKTKSSTVTEKMNDSFSAHDYPASVKNAADIISQAHLEWNQLAHQNHDDQQNKDDSSTDKRLELFMITAFITTTKPRQD